MIALKDIAYGWKIGIAAVLTGATIYTAGNVRMYLYQRDAVEIILGTVERALATQYSTNPVSYSVVPPTLVRNWVTTNGLTGTNFAWITNSVTNTISFTTDRAFMVSLDTTIKALVPYYCDTSSVYSGTTNISMLTVTGLFASLNIGDGTNQFTAIPCFTNNAGQTNATTTAAVYGPWAWRNYITPWQERYKVLNALKDLPLTIYTVTNSSKSASGSGAYNNLAGWGLVKSEADANISTGVVRSTSGWYAPYYPINGGGQPIGSYTWGREFDNSGSYYYPDALKIIWIDSALYCSNPTTFDGELRWYVSLQNPTEYQSDWWGSTWPWWYYNYISELFPVYDANGTPNMQNGNSYGWGTVAMGSNGTASITSDVSSAATWCDTPSIATGTAEGSLGTSRHSTRGFIFKSCTLLFTPQFNYCMNSF